MWQEDNGEFNRWSTIEVTIEGRIYCWRDWSIHWLIHSCYSTFHLRVCNHEKNIDWLIHFRSRKWGQGENWLFLWNIMYLTQHCNSGLCTTHVSFKLRYIACYLNSSQRNHVTFFNFHSIKQDLCHSAVFTWPMRSRHNGIRSIWQRLRFSRIRRGNNE